MMIIPSDLMAIKGYVHMGKALQFKCVYIHDSRNLSDLDLGMLEYRFIVAPSLEPTDKQTIMVWQCNAMGKIGWVSDRLMGVKPESMRKLNKVERKALQALCNGELTFADHERQMSAYYETH